MERSTWRRRRRHWCLCGTGFDSPHGLDEHIFQRALAICSMDPLQAAVAHGPDEMDTPDLPPLPSRPLSIIERAISGDLARRARGEEPWRGLLR